MERQEFVAIVTPLCLAMRSQFDQPTWTVYYRALEDVPAGLLVAAVERAIKSGNAFMPKPGELRLYAEQARQAAIAALPYSPAECEQCDGTGWETLTEHGVERLARCGCWKRHQERLQQLGVGHAPLALPASQEREEA